MHKAIVELVDFISLYLIGLFIFKMFQQTFQKFLDHIKKTCFYNINN